MKEEDKDHQPGCAADEGASTESGADFNPSDAPAADAPAEERSTTRAVPIGRPVSDKEYREMKERARKDNAPSGGHTQEDPAHRKRDG